MNGLNQSTIARYLKQSVGVFLAGMLLVLTVACSAPNTPTASEIETYDTGSRTNLSGEPLPKKGGMNDYDDDVNASTPQLQAKTRALVDTAKRNLNKTADPKDAPQKIVESAEDFKDDFAKGAERRKDEFVQGSKEGMRNLKNNLNKASKEIPEVVKEATDNAKNSVKQSVDSAKDTVGTIKQNVENLDKSA